MLHKFISISGWEFQVGQWHSLLVLDHRVDAVMQQVFSMETENISVLEAVDGDTE